MEPSLHGEREENGKPLKLVKHFTFLGNNISFTKKAVSIYVYERYELQLTGYQPYGNLISSIK